MATKRGTSSSSSRRDPVIKAHVARAPARKSQEFQDFLVAKEGSLPGGALMPPYDPKTLYNIYEQSSLLRPNVDAYMTNIESFGHHFNPTIDLASESAKPRVADAMLYEQMIDSYEQGKEPEAVEEPTPDAVEGKIKEMERTARFEHSRLKAFFAFVCPLFSFTELRRRTRQDLEITGNAYWEVVRNGLNEIAHIYYVNTIPMRLCREDDKPTEVEERIKVTDITWRAYKVRRYFRRFIKFGESRRMTYFKEFGDPRVLSRKTGLYFKSVEELKRKEPESEPATEILHFAIFTPASPYGVPRWIANLPGVLGSRELDEVNYNYFQNNVVPPLALLVSGGRLGKGVSTKIEEYIEEHLKGKKGQHRILVLEAENQRSAGESGPRTVPRVMFVPLRDAQQQDALFQNYDVRNEEKVARSFRLPRILRGDDKQINKATAYAALKFAEEQVFEPERELFDSVVNRRLFPDLGITFYIFRSNSPIVRDPEIMAEMVERFTKIGVFRVKEARELASDIFNRVFEEVSEEWTNKPLPFLLAQLHTGSTMEQLGIGTSTERKPEVDDVETPPSAETAAAAVRRAGTPLAPRGIGYDEEP